MRSRLARSNVYYGWIVVGVCFLGAMVTFGTIYSFSVFFEHIVTEFERSYSEASSVFAVQSIVTFASAAVLGVFIDRYGVRRVFLLGIGLIAAGLIGASTIPVFEGVVVAYGVLAGAGLGITFVASFATVPRWFDHRRGLATGIAASGNGVGVLLWPPLASELIARFGWRRSYALLLVLIVVLLVIAVVLLADDPREMGVDGSAYLDAPPDDPGDPGERLRSVLSVARSKSFGVLFLGFLFAFTPIYVVLVYLVEFTANTGVGRGTGVLAVSLVGVGNVLGNMGVGSFSDRAGVVRTFVLSAALIGASTVLLGLVFEPLAVLALAVAFGIGYGGIAALQPLLVAHFFGTVNVRSLFGLTSPAFAIAGSVVPYLTGLGFDVFGTFVPGFVVGGAVGVLGGLVAPVAYRFHERSAA